jgi:hypothetical protein
MLRAVGEPIVYHDGSQSHSIYGLFDNGYQKVEGIRGPSVGSKSLQCVVALDDVTPKQGDQIFRGALSSFTGEFDFEVVSPRPDESENMARLVLKRNG